MYLKKEKWKSQEVLRNSCDSCNSIAELVGPQMACKEYRRKFISNKEKSKIR